MFETEQWVRMRREQLLAEAARERLAREAVRAGQPTSRRAGRPRAALLRVLAVR